MERMLMDWEVEVSKRLEYARSLLGRKVRIRLDSDKHDIIVEGQLLGFGDGGNFEILTEDGFVHYCWPLLEITPLDD